MTGAAHAARVPEPLGADFVSLEPGFADSVHDAQACFRAALQAMAHPGQILTIPVALAGLPPAPLNSGAAAIALTLCDVDTPIWLDRPSDAATAYLAFHCGAPIANAAGEARFALVVDAAALPRLETFALGSDEYPERSTTLVIQVADLTNGGAVLISGPGICGEQRLNVAGLPYRFWAERAALAELFPRGLDFLFVADDKLAALPRSTRVA
jgi:alpha-D-ribose 1-methylphosphonate 5-triphosphate synthase subunit PhnH